MGGGGGGGGRGGGEASLPTRATPPPPTPLVTPLRLSIMSTLILIDQKVIFRSDYRIEYLARLE